MLHGVNRADRTGDICSSSAAGGISRGVGSAPACWETRVVSSKSPVTAGRSVRSFYVAHRKRLVGFGIAVIEEDFLLLSSLTANATLFGVDY